MQKPQAFQRGHFRELRYVQQLFNKTIIYFYGKSIQMEIINNIILETRAYS